MSSITRFGPKMAKSVLFNPARHMAASATIADPVQRIFVDKVKEFKSSNQGLDEAHQKAMGEEMMRLKRVYKVDDENKLAHFDTKFAAEHEVTLHDLDENKEFRRSIATGEYQRQLKAEAKKPSALIETTPEQVTHDLHLPPINKPDPTWLIENECDPEPMKLGEFKPDYMFVGDKMTPERLQKEMLVCFGKDMPTIHDDKKPERDLVNFPRQTLEENTPATRYHFIPESWFQFFYPKTGASGPYAFAGSFLTFLLSKEWIVWEHELLTGVTTSIILTAAIIKFGPKISAWGRAEVKRECESWENWRLGNIKSLNEMKEHYKNETSRSDVINDLFAIREHDVQMQLEHEYRNRIKSIYEDTKRRLNYLVSVAESKRQITHKNMVNWVISNAVSSIGPKQENEVLDNCISNLKQLGSKNANAI